VGIIENIIRLQHEILRHYTFLVYFWREVEGTQLWGEAVPKIPVFGNENLATCR
jgi:hypothetical protein